MAGIYLHIPFCRQACYYCNFHFTTSFRRKNELVAALLSEINLGKDYVKGEQIETIYFGGGTPSLLSIEDCQFLIEKIHYDFNVVDHPEVTIEVNPDDIWDEKLRGWKEVGMNRLSVGIQSFFQEDLEWMNRAHTAEQAIDSLQLAMKYFENISIDLIYGTPLLTNEKWKQNVDKAVAYDIPHLSCYALTVEPKTPLHKMISEQRRDDINPDMQSEQLLLLMEWMEKAKYKHYEISNFAKTGFQSKHNSSYWQGKKYMGVGPSAHSYDGKSRQWNVSNNAIYIDSINKGIIPFEKEILTPSQQLNEYIMTSLRTIEGLDLSRVGDVADNEIRVMSKKFIERGLMVQEQNILKLTKGGILLADGIAAELFFNETRLQ